MFPTGVAKPRAGGGQVPPQGGRQEAQEPGGAEGETLLLLKTAFQKKTEKLSKKTCAWWGMGCLGFVWCGFLHASGFSSQDT